MKKLLFIYILLTSLNELHAQPEADPAVGSADVAPRPVGGVGSTFKVSFDLSNGGFDDVSGADAANKVSMVIKLQKCVPDFTGTALDALSGTALDLFDFTYNATDTQYTALQKTNTPMEGIGSGKSYQLEINCKVAKLGPDNTNPSVGARLTITPPSSSITNEESNDVGTALTYTVSTLPVQLASFTAIARNCNVQLNWATIGQEKFSHFVVESSANGKSFSNIRTIKAKNGNAKLSYQLMVNSNNADAYYRLRMVDKDGAYEHSDVLKVKVSCSASFLNVAPNPVTHNTVTISGLRIPSVIKLMDINGKTLQTIRSSGPMQKINMGSLPAGIYFLHILQNDEVVKTVKLLKK